MAREAGAGVKACAIAAGVLILAASTWAIIDQSQATGSHAALVCALAVGTAIGAVVMGRGSFAVGLVVALAVVAGEGYGMIATAERILAMRDAQQAPARAAAERKREVGQEIAQLQQQLARVSMSPRLERALAGKAAADAALVAKSAERGCAENCRLLLQTAVSTAATEVTIAEKEIETGRAGIRKQIEGKEAARAAIVVPGSGAALADRLGLSAWVIDLVAAGLLTLGANGLAAVLIGWGAHGRRSQPATVEVVAVPVIAEKREAARPVAEPEPAPKPIGDFVAFVGAAVELAEGGLVAQSELIRGYTAWCRRGQFQPLADDAIERAVEMFCRAGKLERGRRGAEIYIMGIEVATTRGRKPRRSEAA